MWQHLGFSVAKVAKSVESLLFQVKCPWPESVRASGINRESGKPYNRIDFIHITACRGVLAWDWYHHRFCILFQNNLKTLLFFFFLHSLCLTFLLNTKQMLTRRSQWMSGNRLELTTGGCDDINPDRQTRMHAREYTRAKRLGHTQCSSLQVSVGCLVLKSSCDDRSCNVCVRD